MTGDKGAKKTEGANSFSESLKTFISGEFVKISEGYEKVMDEIKEFRKDTHNITIRLTTIESKLSSFEQTNSKLCKDLSAIMGSVSSSGRRGGGVTINMPL